MRKREFGIFNKLFIKINLRNLSMFNENILITNDFTNILRDNVYLDNYQSRTSFLLKHEFEILN